MIQSELRKRLSDIISNGLSAVAISNVTGISKIDLSRFKNGQINLIDEDMDKLEKYLSLVQIPTEI
ncbi:unknown [Roseburia sp. CAG:182]|nr:unknown [Roseburia sp. CAG:182]